jgi:hypothetical protein
MLAIVVFKGGSDGRCWQRAQRGKVEAVGAREFDALFMAAARWRGLLLPSRLLD